MSKKNQEDIEKISNAVLLIKIAKNVNNPNIRQTAINRVKILQNQSSMVN